MNANFPFVQVDTFFVLSGLLVSINMLKHLEKTQGSMHLDMFYQFIQMFFSFHFRNGRINIPLLYFHRYLRLTPLLFMSILFSVSLLRFFGSGPIWPQTMSMTDTCKTYWWSVLLYLQNYVNPNKMVSIICCQKQFASF